MGKKLMPGLFSSISDAELFVASLAAEEEEETPEAAAEPSSMPGLPNKRRQ